MTGLGSLALASAAFVGTHFLMSHPLRRPLVDRMGEGPFRGLYSLVSLATFGWMIWAYRSTPETPPYWDTGEFLWLVVTFAMWFASILFVGSLSGNPALPGAPDKQAPRGVLRITRHPMMWSFAIWAVCHFAVIATTRAAILDGAILLLALGGAAGQDFKKRKLEGEKWRRWMGRTSFLPFGRGPVGPGMRAAAIGTVLFFAATWVHQPWAGVPAGFWRWIG